MTRLHSLITVVLVDFNSLVLKLKEAEVGVKCRKQLISVLL